MSVDECHQRTRKRPVPLPLPAPMPPSPSPSPYENETGAWSSGEILRLVFAPALITLFLVGGVYWIRLQMPAGSAGQQQTSVVRVQLIPRPDSAPIVTASATESPTQTVFSRSETSLKEPDPIAPDDPAPIPRARTASLAETPPSNVLSPPSVVNGSASSAAIRFQQALLRHVAQYQRYPNAARPLQGKVDTQFAIGRDGRLLGVWVRTSSGQMILDKEAIETIRRAQPLPPIPPELPDRLNIDVQLVFDPS